MERERLRERERERQREKERKRERKREREREREKEREKERERERGERVIKWFCWHTKLNVEYFFFQRAPLNILTDSLFFF